MKITDIVLFEVKGEWVAPPFPVGDRNAQQLDVYNAYGPDWGKFEPSPEPQPISGIFVEILTDEGVSGIYGSLYAHQAFLIATELKPFLLGRDALAIELLQDLMHCRSSRACNGICVLYLFVYVLLFK